jgi:hypothetical protein
VCTPIKNTGSAPAAPRAKLPRNSALKYNRPRDYRKNNGAGVPLVANNRNICASLIYPISGSGGGGGSGGGPLEAIWTPNGNGRYAIRIFNSNAVLDDAWDIYVNNVFAFNYDGGTQTSFTWTADLPLGPYSFEARFAAEQSDNFFSWEVTKDGGIIASGDSGFTQGESGEVIALGSFFATP